MTRQSRQSARADEGIPDRRPSSIWGYGDVQRGTKSSHRARQREESEAVRPKETILIADQGPPPMHRRVLHGRRRQYCTVYGYPQTRGEQLTKRSGSKSSSLIDRSRISAHGYICRHTKRVLRYKTFVPETGASEARERRGRRLCMGSDICFGQSGRASSEADVVSHSGLDTYAARSSKGRIRPFICDCKARNRGRLHPHACLYPFVRVSGSTRGVHTRRVPIWKTSPYMIDIIGRTCSICRFLGGPHVNSEEGTARPGTNHFDARLTQVHEPSMKPTLANRPTTEGGEEPPLWAVSNMRSNGTSATRPCRDHIRPRIKPLHCRGDVVRR